jgi:pyruvate dehydrogenase E1 component
LHVVIFAPRYGDLTENASVATIEHPETALKALEAVQDRVLWLATSIIHHANRIRKVPSGVKVGGHQASSASVVSIMTALWFEYLRAQDRVSVKPHASPVLHAIEYLLGALDRRYLTTLREMGGLQSYPSRLKDLERHRASLRCRPFRCAARWTADRAPRRRRA